MKSFNILLFNTLCILFLLENAMAQTFEGGIAAGFNIAQIDGDDLSGYNRIGAYAGPIININTSKKWQVGTGITFSQLGSDTDKYDGPSGYSKVRLNFVEVPLVMRFKDWLQEDEDGDYYRLAFEAGFTYGRLINHKVFAATGEDLSESRDYEPNAININFGATYYINQNWGVHANWAKQLNDLDNQPAETFISRYINIALYYFL